ncbi:DUF748 domain-containing protein [uncultured Pontibacter sp.]|uniref:DUF748 domain-containing protein n=1 Tax=uncultured Pontibacter sp. TaxID=453356 RepID=UPI00261AD221|nr:DUF748 domain-containing protein [uncultured Pontibacter sp.]
MFIKSLLHKWWVWLLLAIIILLLILSVVSATLFSPWLKNKLETTVHQQTKGVYTLKLHGLDAGILTGSISADSLLLTPVFAAWEKLNTAAKTDTSIANEVPRSLLRLAAEETQLKGINLLGIVRGKPLNLNRLQINRPVLILTTMRPDTTNTHEPLHVSLQGIAKNLKIGRIDITGGTLAIRESKEAETDVLSLQDFTVKVKDLQLDSTSFQDKSKAYYAQSMEFASGKATYNLPGKAYRLQASALKANTSDGTLNVGNLKLIPLVNNAALAQRKSMAVTSFNIDVPEINISGLDYSLHSRYNNIEAGNMVIKKPSLSAYMDKKNFNPKGEKPLPHDLVQQLKTGLNVRKVTVQDMYIKYEELSPEATEVGAITFQNADATITNITNDKNLMSAKNPAVINFTASINGDAPLSVEARLNLIDPNAYHTLQGTAGPANPATLNSILEPTAFISIKEGKLQRSDFKIELTRNKATGNLNVRYQDFKVDILTKDADKRQSLGKKIISKVANKVVIKSDNPKEGENLRPGKIEVVRAKSNSFLAYWKDCLVSGFRTAAGVEGIGKDLSDPQR